MTNLKKILTALIYIFALIGFSFIAIYFAVKAGVTNTPGIIDSQNDYFQNPADIVGGKLDRDSTCTLLVGNTYARGNIATIIAVYHKNPSLVLVQKMATTLYLEMKSNPDFTGAFAGCTTQYPNGLAMSQIEKTLGSEVSTTAYTWAQGQESHSLREAIIKDAPAINKAASDAQVEPRLIVSILIVEQLRLFYSNRELFKEIFSPLKILGNQSQFSWGVMGIKEETAEVIEANLKNQTSPYYLGKQYENALNFSTEDPDNERFTRMTNDKDHYYSYFYAGIYLKQFMTQWNNAGFDISKRPEILATLFNIGFNYSKPNENPAVGGAEITIGERIYSFGSLANEFYYSGELVDQFPFPKQ